MSSPLKIRRYIPADRDATLAIWLEASRVGHGFLGEAELQKQKALVRDHYLDASETWLALDGDTPLGFIGLPTGDDASGRHVQVFTLQSIDWDASASASMIRAVEPDAALVDIDEAGDHLQRRRLAAARRPQQRDELPLHQF